MLIIKLFSIFMLLFSNMLFIRGGLVYASSGDVKSAELAKMHIIYSFFGSLLSSSILVITHVLEGFDFHAYSTLDWIFIYSFFITLGIFLISTTLFQIVNRWLYEKIKDKLFDKTTSFLMSCSMITFLLSGLFLQLSLIFINFN